MGLLFAEGNGVHGGWIAFTGVVCTLIGALGKELYSFLKLRHEQGREKRKDALDECWEINRKLDEQNTKLEGQMDRQDTVIRQYQDTIEKIWRSEADCRTALGQVQMYLKFLGTELVKLGVDTSKLPQMPAVEDVRARDMEFDVRQAQQSATLIGKVSEVLKSDPAAGGPA